MFITLAFATLAHASSPQGLTGKTIHCTGLSSFDFKLVRETGPDEAGEGYVAHFNNELVSAHVLPYFSRVADGLQYRAGLGEYSLEITEIQSSLTPGTPMVGITATITNISHTRNAGEQKTFACAQRN